jgi:hypothetical protein
MVSFIHEQFVAIIQWPQDHRLTTDARCFRQLSDLPLCKQASSLGQAARPEMCFTGVRSLVIMGKGRRKSKIRFFSSQHDTWVYKQTALFSRISLCFQLFLKSF